MIAQLLYCKFHMAKLEASSTGLVETKSVTSTPSNRGQGFYTVLPLFDQVHQEAQAGKIGQGTHLLCLKHWQT
ncbi:hypothetical protein SLA2020_284110 [Shorea laevis]